MKRGRKPGYSHSDSTKEKIRNSRLGTKHNPKTRDKIGGSLKGRTKTLEHRSNLSMALSPSEEEVCVFRLAELMETYSEHIEFFTENTPELLLALRDIKAESELRDIARFIESENLEKFSNLGYQYSSSSFYAQEDLMIELLDYCNHLKTLH